MTEERYAFFKRNGYVVLEDVFTDEELAYYQSIFDRDRRDFNFIWKQFAFHQMINCDALVTTPEFDGIIRHPKILPEIEALMGGEVVFSEICIRHMTAYNGELAHHWHRDRPMWDEHPLKMDYIQLMVYLTDVSEESHCFSLSPQGVDDAPLDNDEQVEQRGIVDLHGKAGTVALFNIACLHTATVRPTQIERKTAQIYYGHADRPYLSNDSVTPASLWRDHPDPQTRAFYGKLNPRTRLYLDLPDRPKRNDAPPISS